MKDPSTNHPTTPTFCVIPRAELDSLTQSSREEAHEQEISDAGAELEKEQHESLGILDAAKSLLMWSESSEERVIRRDLNPAEAK